MFVLAPQRAVVRSRGLAGMLALGFVVALLIAGAAPASAFPATLSANGQSDFVYGSAVNSAGGGRGTVHKPESKLFYTGDGVGEPVRWWAVLGTSGPSPVAGVWLFELVDHDWVARVQLPGADPWAKADALFEGGTLYVSTRDDLATSGSNIRQSSLYEIPYSGGGAWGTVRGPFPIATVSLETLTLARDSADRLWVTYERNGQIQVGYTSPGGTSFTFVTVSATNVSADDISTITAFGGNRIGVFWSDQNAKKDFFAWRPDSAAVTAPWTIETAYGGGVGACPTATSDLCADDHMNLKVYQDQIYVSIKSSLNDAVPNAPGDPLNSLLRRTSGGTWSAFPVTTVSQNVTRPITLLSPSQDKIWVWGTRGQEVDVWESSFTSPAFSSGAFIPWTKGSGSQPGDPTSTKQVTTALSGEVVESSTSSQATYWHNEFLPVPSGNQDPTFDQDLPDRTDAEGAAISLSAHATDPELDPLTYAAQNLPPGLSINAASGQITGSISAGASAGSPYAARVTVSDDGGATVGDTDTFAWTVTGGGGGGSIAFRSSSTGANATATNLILPSPAGVQAGDVMVAVIDVRQTPQTTTPAGWTLVSMTPNGTAYRQFVYTKVAGSEPVSYEFTFNQRSAASGAVVAYSGVDTASPVETFTAAIGSATDITGPSATTAFGGARVVGAFSINNSSAIAPPAGMTERGEVASGAKITTEVADMVQPTPGSTGDRIATAATGTANIGQLVVLRPAAT